MAQFPTWIKLTSSAWVSTSLGKSATRRFRAYCDANGITTEAEWDTHIANNGNLTTLLRAFVKQELVQVKDSEPGL